MNRLQARKKSLKMTLKDIESRSGVKAETIRAYLRNRAVPSVTNAQRIAMALSCEVWDLWPINPTSEVEG